MPPPISALLQGLTRAICDDLQRAQQDAPAGAINRRLLLKLGLGGAAIAGLGAGATIWGLVSHGSPASGRTLLDAQESVFVMKAAEAYFPEENPIGVPASAIDVASHVDGWLASLGAKEAKLLRSLLSLFDLWPRLSGSSTDRFSELALEDRVTSLRAFDDSSIELRRGLAQLLRLVVSMAYFEDDAVLRAIGHKNGCEVTFPVARPKVSLPLQVAPTAPSAALADGVRPISAAEDRALQVEVVVVGTGAGGAVAGTELARAGRRVLFLEAGGAFTKYEFHRRKLSWSTRNLFAYGGVQLARGQPPVIIPQGRCLGGSTVLNSGICFRPPDERLDEWAEVSGADWLRPDAMRPIVDEIWTRLAVAPTHQGIGRRHNDALRIGLERLGIEHDWIQRNAPGCVGCGICHLGCPSGGKASVDKAFLPEALNHGAAIRTRAEVESVIVEGGRATGVEVVIIDDASGARLGTTRVKADRVLLAGSALATPRILQRSGLGGGECGRHLAIHPGTGALAEFDDPVVMWDGVPQGYWGKDPAIPDVTIESMSVGPGELHAMLGGPGVEGARAALGYRHLALGGGMLRDNGEGTVEDAGPGAPSVVYNLSDDDVSKSRAALKTLVRAYFASGARRVAPLVNPLRFFERESDALAAVDAVQSATDFARVHGSHPHGTCRMGPAEGPHRGVTNAEGQVHGVEGLYIVDGSVFPSTLGVNPQITIMSVALAMARRMA